MATSHLAQGPAGYMGPVNSFAKNCWSWLAACSLGGALLSALLKLLFWTTVVLNGHNAQTAIILLINESHCAFESVINMIKIRFLT